MRGGLELAGRYRLEAPLGQGGMGEVWQGIDLRLRRPVAVKILPLSGAADEAGVARFRREAETAAALNHPGITTVFDIDEYTDGGLHLLFLVMELMRGHDLASILREHPDGLPMAQVTDWAMQTLDALAAAHRHGVVHRDIKPANLFLTDDGRVKICDFGISRLADATKITATGSSAGTPIYMAPEQIEGHVVDERTDLYAFGCVLYQLLTGTTWMDTDSSVGAILYQHLNRTSASPQSVRPDIDDHISTLVLDLLAKQPDGRPKDAATVAEHLRSLASRPTSGGGSATPQQPRPERPAQAPRQLDPAPEPAGGPVPPAGRATQPSSMPGTAPLPHVTSTRGARGIPQRPDAASTHTPARHGGLLVGMNRATRFGLPVCLWLLFSVLYDFRFPTPVPVGLFGFHFVLLITLVLTEVLTPRSGGLTRGTGYGAAALIAVGLVIDEIQKWKSGWFDGWLYNSPRHEQVLLHAGIVLAIATYCYREIKTRRARSARGSSDTRADDFGN
ncbi:serine/threonine-protein kinase [Actinomadura harenae]|uniref:non-specific serine/threonine protein kinase n=1 Tax=Actinomadura harenae TaxID=2483351 RepID=A0A3M2M5B8_9ACTN|nr:serine/threonine-protein kinase [Actinomadura harenae]RMI44954.1 serine/threonine protein kinase [Actinomadura harenae]